MEANVLVVDDDDSVRRQLADYVTVAAGSAVDVARDGADALHAVRTRHYDVVLLDVVMPYMSGIDFLVSLAALKTDPSFQKVDEPHVIVMTGAAEIAEGDLEQRFPELVHCVHRKPLDLREVAKCIREVLGRDVVPRK